MQHGTPSCMKFIIKSQPLACNANTTFSLPKKFRYYLAVTVHASQTVFETLSSIRRGSTEKEAVSNQIKLFHEENETASWRFQEDWMSPKCGIICIEDLFMQHVVNEGLLLFLTTHFLETLDKFWHL